MENVENKADENRDALLELARKSKDIFIVLYTELLEKYPSDMAKEIALALTPRPMDILSTLYTPGWEEPPFVNTDDLPDDEPEDSLPDDEVLKNWGRENDGKEPEK